MVGPSQKRADAGDADVAALAVNDDERNVWHMVASDDLDVHGGHRWRRLRRSETGQCGSDAPAAGGWPVLKIELDGDDLGEIAKAGYADAITTDPEKQAQAARLFITDAIYG